MTALDTLKGHLNIIGTTDDVVLADILADAIAHTRNFVGYSPTLDDAPRPVRRAILMLAAHWYENREATLVGVRAEDVPFGYHDLLLPYREWIF